MGAVIAAAFPMEVEACTGRAVLCDNEHRCRWLLAIGSHLGAVSCSACARHVSAPPVGEPSLVRGSFGILGWRLRHDVRDCEARYGDTVPVGNHELLVSLVIGFEVLMPRGTARPSC